jgi:amino acid adenylation domain-containing protein
MSERLAHDYLNDTAALYSEKIAVTDGHIAITFGELAAFSDHLAHFLIKLGVTRGDHVAYYLKRSSACLPATVGIMKAGAAYIPLDQKTPGERWRQIIDDATPQVLLCDHHTLAETLVRTGTLTNPLLIVCLSPREDRFISGESVYYREDIENTTVSAVLPKGAPDDVAYTLYTSGSTGAPKGVMVTHGNIRNYIDWALSYFNITVEDRILATAPFYFDMSTFDIFCMLASGATLYIATEDILLFPERLARLIESNGITLWKGVSSLLMYMSRAGVLRPGRMPSLHTVIFAGEPLAAQYLVNWMKNLPDISFFNGYGPTEATGVSLCYHVDHLPEPSQSIPIGQPCKGARVAVMGEDGLPVKPGEVGELIIAGPCLAKGYLNDPEKTRRSFTSPPPGCGLEDRVYWTGDLVRQTPEGDYVFVSRKDYQVKWMGYRIELAEIETNLSSHPKVRDVAVLLEQSGSEGLTELAAYIESEADTDFSDLRIYLEKRVPSYMIPKRFIRVDTLPRNDRGKIDREEILRRFSVRENKLDDRTH